MPAASLMWSGCRGREFSRTLVPRSPVSHKRAQRRFWGGQPPLSGNRARAVGGVVVACRGFFPSVDNFLAGLAALSDWWRARGGWNFPAAGVWVPGGHLMPGWWGHLDFGVRKAGTREGCWSRCGVCPS